MDILYTTKTPLTYEEYLRMYKFSRKKSKRLNLAVLLLMAALVLIDSLTEFDRVTVFLIFVGTVLALLEYYQEKVVPKKYFASYKSGVNSELTINFYPDKLVQLSDNGSVVVQYDEIYKIHETKTNFYIRISAREVIIVAKENCTAELCDFIRSKM